MLLGSRKDETYRRNTKGVDEYDVNYSEVQSLDTDTEPSSLF